MTLVIDQIRIGLFRPAPRNWTYFIWERTYDHRYGHALRRKEGQLVLPVQARRRNAGVGQPVERDVGEDVVARQTLRCAIENARDQLVAPDVVIDDPGRQAGRR